MPDPNQIGLTAIFDDKQFQKGVASYQESVNAAEKETEGISAKMTKAGDIAKGAFVVGIAAAAAGAAAFVGAAKIGIDSLIDWNDQVNTLSDNLGTSGAESSKWAVAFNHVGLSVDEGGAGLNFFVRTLADYDSKVKEGKAETSDFGNALGKLGISAYDSSGGLKTFDDLMPELLDAFANLPAGIDKSATAMELFGGRAGTKFLDFLSQGSAGLADAKKFAEDFGLALDTDASNSTEEFGFIINDVNLGIKGFLMTIGKEMLPIVRDLASFVLSDVLPPLIKWGKEVLPDIIAGAKDVVLEIKPFIDGLFNLAREMKHVLDGGEFFEDFGADFAALFGDNEEAVGAFVLELGTKLSEGRMKILNFWNDIQPILRNFEKWLKTDGVAALQVFFDKVGNLETITLPKWNSAITEMGVTFQLVFGKNGIIKTDSEFTLPTFAALVETVMTRAQIMIDTKLDFIKVIFQTFNNVLRGDWKQVFQIDIPNIVNAAFDLLLGMIAQDGASIRAGFQNFMDTVVADFYGYGGQMLNQLKQGLQDSAGQLNSVLWQIIQDAINNALGGGGGNSFRAASARGMAGGAGGATGAPMFSPAVNTGGQFQPTNTSTVMQSILNQGSRSVQIVFAGSGGPTSQSEAGTQGAMVVSEMRARGMDF